MKKILLIEDDENLGPSLKKFLQDEGYSVTLSQNLDSASKVSYSEKDIIILDWMLPDGQGVDFLRKIRAEKIQTPVIMLTARTELIDKVIGLESGANDYMTKPFEPRELMARVRAQLRDHDTRGKSVIPQAGRIVHGDLVIDNDRREVVYKGIEVEFTKMEFDFLRLLTEAPGRAFSREEILNKVWGYENYPSTRTVDTHVLQIRQKLDENLIETVRGIGYRFRPNE